MSKLVRGTAAVLATIAVFFLLTFAAELAFRAVLIRFHPQGAVLSENFSWMISQWRYMFPALLAVAFMTAVLPPMHPRTFIIAIACVQSLVIVRAEMLSSTDFVPPWLWTGTLVLVPVIFCLGFWAPVDRRFKERRPRARLLGLY